MFIGHFGLGFAAKKLDQRPSLGTLFLAAQWIDLIWPLLLLANIEKVTIEPGNTAFTPLNFIYYPFTHSFLGVLIWAILFAGIYYLLKKNGRGALLLGGLVVSHWFLDLLTHRPDLPLFPGLDVKVGLGLWNSVPLTMLVEGAIFLGGFWLYYQLTQARNRIGNISMWSLAIFLLVVYIMNVFGSPPPSSEAIGYVGLSQWLIVAWGYWVDRNRTSTSA